VLFDLSGGRTMTNITRRSALTSLVFAALGLAPLGCGDGRPPNVANQPGDNYVELTDPTAELVQNSELKMRVHYHFVDDLPHPDTWFQFYFELNDGKSGLTLIRRQGRELKEEGDIEASSSLAFIIRTGIRVRMKVQQSKSKGGPWHDVSDVALVES
jgi:hypothetical protein